jgi:predicted nuclease of predicted toxin-antitoxin system
MLILLDNNIPRGLARALNVHTVVEARARGWHLLKNGDLLQAAEDAAFDVIVTSDKSIKYQQNLTGRRIALVVLSQGRWRLVRQRLEAIAAAVDAATPGSYIEVELPVD